MFKVIFRFHYLSVSTCYRISCNALSSHTETKFSSGQRYQIGSPGETSFLSSFFFLLHCLEVLLGANSFIAVYDQVFFTKLSISQAKYIFTSLSWLRQFLSYLPTLLHWSRTLDIDVKIIELDLLYAVTRLRYFVPFRVRTAHLVVTRLPPWWVDISRFGSQNVCTRKSDLYVRFHDEMKTMILKARSDGPHI